MTCPTDVVCECGCGKPVNVAISSNTRTGHIKGKPFRFVKGHNFRGKESPTKSYRERGHQREHVVIAEQALGKPLPKGAHVHHVDEDKHNNANANLVICQDAAFHHLLHLRARIVRAGGDPNIQRLCYRCKLLKPINAMVKRHSGRRNLTSECVACSVIAARKWRQLNPERYRARYMEYNRLKAGGAL